MSEIISVALDLGLGAIALNLSINVKKLLIELTKRVEVLELRATQESKHPLPVGG